MTTYLANYATRPLSELRNKSAGLYFRFFLMYDGTMYLAIDIGATKTLVAVFSKRGRVIRKIKFKTAQGSKTFLADLTETLAEFKKYRISTIVVAIPGTVQKNYSVHFGNRAWDGIDIFTPIKNLFDCKIYFENDANLAAIYESRKLPGRTVFLTFSTGLGGGVVQNGRIVPEFKDFEPGREKYVYNGKEMRWEDIAAASSIEKAYHVDRATELRKRSMLQDIAARIYLGLPDVAKKCAADTIVLGGPMGKIFQLYVRYIPKIPGVRLRKPKRPTESVIYGCYLYAKTKEQE